MKQLIEEVTQKNKQIERKLKVLGLDIIDGIHLVEEKNQCIEFKQEIEYSNLKQNVASMEKNIKCLMNQIEQHKILIESLNECLGGKVNVSEMKQAAAKRQITLQELKKSQIENDNTILNIIQKLKELEQ